MRFRATVARPDGPGPRDRLIPDYESHHQSAYSVEASSNSSIIDGLEERNCSAAFSNTEDKPTIRTRPDRVEVESANLILVSALATGGAYTNRVPELVRRRIGTG